MLSGDSGRPSSNDDDTRFHATFDPYDFGSWFFGAMGREPAQRILLNEHDDGVFLVRESESSPGSYVLCVRESGRDSLVSQYLIAVTNDPSSSPSEERKLFIIGQQTFTDLPSLLNFYKLHYLESTPLVRPAPRQSVRVRAKFDFVGDQPDTDLPFKKGETLWVVQKDDDPQNSWWMAKNALGQTGQIPSSYVEIDPGPEQPGSSGLRERNSNHSLGDRSSGGSGASGDSATVADDSRNSNQPAAIQRQLPAYAKVKQARIPNAYDKSALRLEVGDRILVTKMNPSGTWEGELNGRRGHFPFTYVEWIDQSPNG